MLFRSIAQPIQAPKGLPYAAPSGLPGFAVSALLLIDSKVAKDLIALVLAYMVPLMSIQQILE